MLVPQCEWGPLSRDSHITLPFQGQFPSFRECRLQHSLLALIKFKLCCAVCCVASGSNPALYVLSKCLSFYFLFCCLVPGIRAFFPHLKCTMGLEYAVGQTWAQLKPRVLWPKEPVLISCCSPFLHNPAWNSSSALCLTEPTTIQHTGLLSGILHFSQHFYGSFMLPQFWYFVPF